MPDPVVPLDPDRLDAIEEEALRKRDEPDFSIVILKPDEAAALVTGVRDRDRLHRHEGILAIKLTTANQLRVKAEAERDALRADLAAAEADAALCRERLGDERERRRQAEARLSHLGYYFDNASDGGPDA